MLSTMVWRVWSIHCCGQKWLLLLFPLFLLLLTISVMTMTLPPPLPPADIDRRLSRALSSAGEFRSKSRVTEAPLANPFQPPAPILSRAWNTSSRKEKSKQPVSPKRFSDAARNNKNSREKEQEKSHTDSHRNKHRSKTVADAIRHPTSHHRPILPQFTVNTRELKHRIKPSNHSAVVLQAAQAYIYLKRSVSTTAHTHATAETLNSDRQAGRWRDGHRDRTADMQTYGRHTTAKLVEHHKTFKKTHAAMHSGKSDNISNEQQAVKKPWRSLKKHHLSDDPSKGKNDKLSDDGKALSKPKRAGKEDDSNWCPRFTEQDFPDGGHRRLRISPDLQPVPWLSQDDIQKMELLVQGEVVSKARVPAHGQVLQVALEPLTYKQQPSLMTDSLQHKHGKRNPESHDERCQRGRCSLIKRIDDWFEVFAFHLDRVLGLNRSLPAVMRTFHSDILPYRYTSGTPRPVLWWEPDIQHLADQDNDQNSVPLSWVQYQKLLRVHCGSETDLRSPPCVGVHHSEWGKLALLDFLLQVNDRLDRYCCGFTPDPSDICVENLLHAKCDSTQDLLLVHILVKKADPSRLVFIDNAGRPQQPNNNLNFRLVEGIDEFPEKAVSVLQSGCLESLLLRSLYTDKEFWDSRGGLSGLRPLIHTVEQRGRILLQHIRDRNLHLKRDL